MEKDDDWTGSTGTHYDFGARIYDSRLGRWLSVDPLWKSYPKYSPYVYAVNNPIYFLDPDGMKIGNPFSKYTRNYKSILKKTEFGSQLWKEMRKDSKIFYFHSLAEYPIPDLADYGDDYGGYLEHPNQYINTQLTEFQGKITSGTEYDHMQSSEIEIDPNIHLSFNENTGNHDNIDEHWKETHIFINEERILEDAVSIYYLQLSAAESIGDPELVKLLKEQKADIIQDEYEQFYVMAIFEEVYHAIRQSSIDLYHTEYNEETGKYTNLGTMKDYITEREFEDEARDAAEKGFGQYLDSK